MITTAGTTAMSNASWNSAGRSDTLSVTMRTGFMGRSGLSKDRFPV